MRGFWCFINIKWFYFFQDFRSPTFFRHTREGGYPFFSTSDWIPAYAGMTKNESPYPFSFSVISVDKIRTQLIIPSLK